MNSPSLSSRLRLVATVGWQEHGVKLPWVIIRRGTQYGWRKCFGEKQFEFAGRRLDYVINSLILDNERAVEVALGLDFVRHAQGSLLEVGNVLNNYREFSHTVVDKYEKGPGIINEDVVTYSPATKFNYIVTLSTLEHVGWDETPKEPEKIIAAITALKNLLAPGGRLLATMPLGHNGCLDQLIREQCTGFSDVRFMKRISADNRWREVPLDQVLGSRYGSPYPCANAIIVGQYQRND
jgi:hypothetical protein